MRKTMALLICGLAGAAQADDRLATLFTARFDFGQGPLLDGTALSLNTVQYQRDDNRFQPLAGYGYRRRPRPARPWHCRWARAERTRRHKVVSRPTST